jgi:capsular polysaccharide transport system permease protein
MLELRASIHRAAQAIWAIALRELRRKYGRRRLGLFWAFVEPIGYISVITLVMTLIRERTSPLGGDVAAFLTEGLFGYMLFNTVEKFVSSGLERNAPLLVFPRIRPLTIFVGRMIVEASTIVSVFAVIFATMIIFDLTTLPHDPLRLLIPVCLAILLGFAVGVINAYLSPLAPAWRSTYKIIARLNFFISGKFFIADAMPTEIRAMLYYTPLIHINEWIRSAWRNDFESRFLNPTYIVSFVICAMLLALLIERVLRRQVVSKL